MSSTSDTDPYIDPATGILKNLLGINTGRKLAVVEADISAVVLASLRETPISGNFDLPHLRDIHWEIFNILYAWAGELRRVEVPENDRRFTHVDAIETSAINLFASLHSEDLLKGLPRERYVERLAHYYSKLYVIRPFRNGNGRTLRAFFELLVKEAGYHLNWEHINAQENIESCMSACQGDESKLVQMLEKCLSE